MPKIARFHRRIHWVLFGLALTACQTTQPVQVGEKVQLPPVNTTQLSQLLAPGEELEILTFPNVGRMTVTSLVENGGGTVYAVPVARGQTLSIGLSSTSDAAYFDVVDASNPSGAAVFMGETAGRSAQIRAPNDTTYLIRARLPVALANRGEAAEVGLDVGRGAAARAAATTGTATAPPADTRRERKPPGRAPGAKSSAEVIIPSPGPG